MLTIVPHTVTRVGRSYEHFPDGFEPHLLPCSCTVAATGEIAMDSGCPLAVHTSVMRAVAFLPYRGTSLIRNSPPPEDPHRALRMGLL